MSTHSSRQDDENQANRELAAKIPQVGESNRIADQEMTTPDRPNRLSEANIDAVKSLQAEIRAVLPQLAPNVMSAATALMAAIDSQLVDELGPNGLEVGHKLTSINQLIHFSVHSVGSDQIRRIDQQVEEFLGAVSANFGRS